MTAPPSARASVPERVVDVRGLAIGWRDVVLAEDITFHVDHGEIFAILGGSGAGKTTLLRFLVGLERPMRGEIRVLGEPPDLERGPPRFGVMFQHGALFGSLTTRENVALPLEEWTDLPPEGASMVALAKLRIVGLEDDAPKLPSQLSGGMRKRAAIARALALDPPLVFLDEPSSGLDPITSAGIDDLVLTLSRTMGLTVVVVSHEIESVFRIADRCILLDKEERGILAEGDPRALRDSRDPRVHDFFNRVPRPERRPAVRGGGEESS